jgi:hypothetical protein
MENREFVMPSGAKLHVTPAPFKDAQRLHNEVLRALKGSNLGGLDIEKAKAAMAKASPESMGEVLGMVADVFLSLGSSEPVQEAVFACGARATYSFDGSDESRQKLQPGLFDDTKAGETARADYYAIVKAVLEVNVGPFFKAAFSALSARQRNGAAAPASK